VRNRVGGFRLIASSAAASMFCAMSQLTTVSSATTGLDPGVGNVPQGLQSNSAYAASFKSHAVTNVFVTSQQVSCYTPEVPSPFNNGPNDGYTGELPCPGATTREEVGPYASQATSRTGYPATTPMLVTDHSESDIRVDPTNPNHIIGSSKWFTGAEGYNHLLGFYESWDGGKTWPTMGHVPGYEGFTDNTDPVGAFDYWGNYYQALLPYQFYYDKSGFKKYETGNEPNPGIDNEAVSVAVRPHGATDVKTWLTTHNGRPDNVFTTNAGLGQEPDKEWIAIDRNLTVHGKPNPTFNRIYMMYVNFNGNGSKPYVQWADGHADGTHTDWSAPVLLPTANGSTNNNTYLFPHVDPDGVVYTSIINYASKQGSCCVNVLMDFSTDGGATWFGPSTAASRVHTPPLSGAGYANTTFEDGIEETFAVGNQLSGRHYPVYIAYESKSSGFGNILLTASYDQGTTWASPVQVNDERDRRRVSAESGRRAGRHRERQLLRPPACVSLGGHPGRRRRRSRTGPVKSGLLGPAAVRREQLLHHLERPVLLPRPEAKGSQHPDHAAQLGPAAEQPRSAVSVQSFRHVPGRLLRERARRLFRLCELRQHLRRRHQRQPLPAAGRSEDLSAVMRRA